jgi:hypothetical protein
MNGSNLGLIRSNWYSSFKQSAFKPLLFIGVALMFILLSLLPAFFSFIEGRQGYYLNDWLLNKIPAVNVSVPIFVCIWGSVALLIITIIKHPSLFLQFLYAYLLLLLVRYASIYFFPLEAPPELIVLRDPLSNSFYGTKFITKDLFFSGHTSTLFLMYFFQNSKPKRLLTLFASLAVGVLVLLQHIHYTIDVIIAFPAAFLCFKTSNFFLRTFFPEVIF